MSHPRHRLDDRFTSPIRLSIVAALAQVSKAEFRVIRETVEVSDSTLSKQLTQLADAGYLTISKAAHGRHTRTWLSLTQSGRRALDEHLAALREIAETTPANSAAEHHE
ncbi:MarR family transcriptional regulator [Enemella evansiae]|uniref:MarR family transcriptional regulator n=1 Tax=Enemella evansiae TaxID=2016499 RepID=A0A255G3T1_9ACTN|nr:transcriptional regulator [Enemella evansiae]OYO10525.1 MarR family transcriptional regulator [Enemella evansiae]